MPKFVDVPWTFRPKAALTLIGLVWAAGLAWSPAFRFVGLCVVVFVGLSWLYQDRRLRRLSAERQGEDIGSFARAFDRRAPHFDAWVIRAVWDALQPYRTHRGGAAPLRPSDNLESFMDGDDVLDIVASEVAQRTGRTLDNLEANPKYGQVETVADLVEFLWHQPSIKEPDLSLEPASVGHASTGCARPTTSKE